MNDKPSIEPATNTLRRRKWQVLIALALIAVFAVTCTVVWWQFRESLSDEERHLVGTWTYQWDDYKKDLGLEYEFRADRTCRIRSINPNNGAVISETTNTMWRLSGNGLIVRHPDVLTRTPWRLLPSQRSMDEVSILTPDGPNRFRYKGTIKSTPAQPPVTGTMTRVVPAE